MEKETITIQIQRGESREYFEVSKTLTLLAALYEIKEEKDATLTFSAGCRSSICGACTVRVNEKEVLACAYTMQENDVIQPLKYHPLLRDLKVDRHHSLTTLKNAQSWIKEYHPIPLTDKEIVNIETQSDCILCSACYSSCPVYAVNPHFLGPFTLTHIYRLSEDLRENKEHLTEIQNNGIWDCTLCGACSEVCPKGIDSKMDIMNLRMLSIQNGYSDPSFQTNSFGTPDFSMGF